MSVTRVTFSSNQLLVRDNLFRVQRQYQEATLPATTGKKINNLSDDSGIISSLFSLRGEVKLSEQYQRNIISAKSFLEFGSSQLALSSETLEKIREVALQGNDAGTSAEQRSQLNTRLDDLKTELLSYANSRYEGRYIFSGTASTTQPFQGDPVTFNGNSNSLQIQINTGVQITTNSDGNDIFMGNTTTAASASLATTLKNSDGVSLNIASGDTITIAGTLGTAFSTTLAVTSTTTLANIASSLQTALRAASGSSGNEIAAVQSNGSIRITSGTSAITGVTLSISGKTAFNTAFTYPTPITAGGGTGSSNTLLSGTGENIFDVIDDLKTAIGAGDTAAFATHLDRLDSGLSQIRNGEAQSGTRLQQIESIETSLSENRLRLIEHLSIIEDASVEKSLSDLVSREAIMRLVFSTSSRIMNVLSGLKLDL